MGFIIRGAKNAFRTTVRTVGITTILGVSIGLALIMLVALKAVQGRIESVKSSIGNTITISPAGVRGFDGGGDPLTQSHIDDIKNISHIADIIPSLNENVTQDDTTNLKSAVEPGIIGQRKAESGARAFQGQIRIMGKNGIEIDPSKVKLPIPVTGVTNLDSAQLTGGGSINVIEGEGFDASTDENKALLGKDLAAKNDLKPGSTFKLYGTDVTVTGIYDSGNTFSNNSIVVPLATLQRLSSHKDELSSITVKTDSVSNTSAVETALKEKLGNKADVVSRLDEAEEAVAPLENIQSIARFSLIGALVAGAVILLLTMLMIVRERRKEIGVLKAIGATNSAIVVQYMSESLVLTLLGSVIGMIGGALLSNPILQALVNQSTPEEPAINAVRGGGPVVMRLSSVNVQETLTNLSAVVSYDIILYGLGVAVAIAIVGTAVPAWFSARIRPAEVLRGE